MEVVSAVVREVFIGTLFVHERLDFRFSYSIVNLSFVRVYMRKPFWRRLVFTRRARVSVQRPCVRRPEVVPVDRRCVHDGWQCRFMNLNCVVSRCFHLLNSKSEICS